MNEPTEMNKQGEKLKAGKEIQKEPSRVSKGCQK